MFVDFNILNQLGSPSINSNTFANRPAAGQTGRLFVSTDTFEIYRDNGTTWDLIGGPGSSTITGTGTATQVAYFTSSQAIGSSSNLYWDNTNTRLGIGTATPGYTIEANGAVKADRIYLTGATAANGALYWTSDRVTLANYNVGGIVHIETNGGLAAAIFAADYTGTFTSGIGTRGYTGSPSYAGLFNGSVGINTATPGTSLDVHGTGTLQQLNTTGATANNYLAFQRTGTTTFSIGDTYNGGSNYFRIFGNSLSADILQIFAATGKSTLTATETYSTGLARGNYLQYTLTVPAGTSFSTPNAITAFGATLDFRPAGNATIPGGARTGLDARNSVSFTGAGTLTMTQPGTNTRAFSNLTTGWAFAGTAIGTITELAGLRILFPDNSGSAINVTNNYALLINSQTANTGTITYTNRWGIYQEGASDLNYLAANLLIGSTTNSGEALQVTGTAKITSTLTANSLVKSGGTAAQILAADGSVITAGTNITITAGQISSTGGGISGSGTTNYLPKFTAATTVGDSRFFDNGTVTFLGNGDVNAAPSTGIFSGTGGSGTNIAGAELRIRGGASTGNAAGGAITFYTSAAGSAGSGVNAPTEVARFTTAGRLGIGTSTPNSLLQINGTASVKLELSGGTNQNGIFFNAVGSAPQYFIGAGNNLLNTGDRGIVLGLNVSTSTAAIFWNQVTDAIQFGAAASTERMRITSTGTVGIGTTTIGSTLQVNGNAAIGYSASTAAPTNGLAVNGLVGIATTSPKSYTAMTVNGQLLTFNNLLVNAGSTIKLNAYYNSATITDKAVSAGFAGDYFLNNSTGSLLFRSSATSFAADADVTLVNRMEITSSGETKLTPSANTAMLSTTGAYSLTGANAQSLIDLAGTWNTTGNPTAIKLNITNTASGASAYLMDLQVGAATQFRVTKAGAIRTAAPTTGTANDWKLGSRVAAAVVLDTTQYIELEVGGTLYKLAIVT